MKIITTGVPTVGDYFQTLCLHKNSVGADCVTIPSKAVFEQYYTARCHILHIRQFTKDERQFVTTLKSEGISFRAITKKLRVSVSTVS